MWGGCPSGGRILYVGWVHIFEEAALGEAGTHLGKDALGEAGNCLKWVPIWVPIKPWEKWVPICGQDALRRSGAHLGGRCPVCWACPHVGGRMSWVRWVPT